MRIGVFRDEALSFYYPENLEALERAGRRARLRLAAVATASCPRSTPSTSAAAFPRCTSIVSPTTRPLRAGAARRDRRGMPVYAECGGLMYLARELIVDGVSHPMVGVLDLVVEQTARPQGHGYVEAEVDRPNPFFPAGTPLRGHEFHYSRVVAGTDAGGEHAAAASRAGLGRAARRAGQAAASGRRTCTCTPWGLRRGRRASPGWRGPPAARRRREAGRRPVPTRRQDAGRKEPPWD